MNILKNDWKFVLLFSFAMLVTQNFHPFHSISYRFRDQHLLHKNKFLHLQHNFVTQFPFVMYLLMCFQLCRFMKFLKFWIFHKILNFTQNFKLLLRSLVISNFRPFCSISYRFWDSFFGWPKFCANFGQFGLIYAKK